MPDPVLLKACLDRLAAGYGPEYLVTDPLGVVHRYAAAEDIETAGFAVSAIAYGGAAQIRKSAHELLDRTDGAPGRFAAETSPEEIRRRFRGFTHRWTRGDDMAALFAAAGTMLREYGGIGACVRTFDDPAEETIEGALTRWTAWLRRLGLPPSLVPSPADGSACKRPAMYFRWMTRGPDGIDFGLWRFITPARLVVPLDTHIARMARRLGLTARRTPGWKMALAVTRALRTLDPEDPVRYDFALVRPGIVRECPPSTPGECRDCVLAPVCGETACD